MTPAPFPGVNEADLVSKAAASVVQGLKKSNQVPPWPDIRESLLELHSILDEWYNRAEATTLYAKQLARLRTDPQATRGRISHGGTNVGGYYISTVKRDTKKVLYGSPSIPSRLSPSRKRKVMRRGLRTILATYCPELLLQFEEAVNARIDWVNEHKKEFDQWFAESHTNEQVTAVLAEMTSTQVALGQAKEQLRGFIAANFPLSPGLPG